MPADSRNSVKDRAEDIMLSAEALERQMRTAGVTPEALLLISDVVRIADDLYEEVRDAG